MPALFGKRIPFNSQFGPNTPKLKDDPPFLLQLTWRIYLWNTLSMWMSLMSKRLSLFLLIMVTLISGLKHKIIRFRLSDISIHFHN
jgi:hypothetical protein